jgi:hypothetical protein
MRGMFYDDGTLVINSTQVDIHSTGATFESQNDVLLMRFYLGLAEQFAKPPSAHFSLAGINDTAATGSLIGRIRHFQARQGCVIDGKISVPPASMTTSGGKSYTIRQLAVNWLTYKVAHKLPSSMRMRDHPLCPGRLKMLLVIQGLDV